MIYQEITDGILIRVRPAFSLADSSLDDERFVFTYQVEMVNGEGVVGLQPLLGPGGEHQYRSYCVLKSPAGYMEGHYIFERPDGSRFKVKVPRFSLAAFLPGPDEAEMN